MSFIEENVAALRARIRGTAERFGRNPADIRLLAVSKTRPAADIEEAHRCGLHEFGENYLQEAEAKIAALTRRNLQSSPVWHFIGPIQSNKTRLISRDFDWVHSVDRLKIARRLGEQRPPGRPPINILLQVNIDEEPQKAGISADAVEEMAHQLRDLPGIRLRGLMAIPAPRQDFEAQRQPLAAMRRIFDALRADCPDCDTLSMGMSGDLEAAIAEGSTLLRIGTALFGARPAKPSPETDA